MTDNCPTCDNPIGELRDDASKREASISGLCQGCQDDYFGPDDRTVRRTAAKDPLGDFNSYEMECYGCGEKGDNEKFGLGYNRQCPSCKSYEVHGVGLSGPEYKSSSKEEETSSEEIPAWITDSQDILG